VASLKVVHTLICNVGVYTLSGVSANPKVAKRLICESGTYSYIGNVISLAVTKKLLCSSGSFILSGNNTGLVYTSGQQQKRNTIRSGVFNGGNLIIRGVYNG
jgi:hypothetical protein